MRLVLVSCWITQVARQTVEYCTPYLLGQWRLLQTMIGFAAQSDERVFAIDEGWELAYTTRMIKKHTFTGESWV